jgi:mRNA-degrading endonuclease RelE of RelBE toxin-antitoxin system
MKYRILVHKSLQKFFCKHPGLKTIFKEKSEKLSNIENWNSLDWKKMKGFESDYRLRIGKYRFIATVIKDEILIYFYEADLRGNIY